MIWEEKLATYELIRKSSTKTGFEAFLKNIENLCLDPKYRIENIRNRKSTPEAYLQDTGWNFDFEKKNFFEKDFIKEFIT